MRTQKTRLGLLTLAFFSMLLATPGTYAQELVIEPGDPIIIGMMTVLRDAESDIGVASVLGVILAQEVRHALRFGNNLFPIMLYPYDSACSDVEGAAAATKLVEDGRAVAVIGPNCSSACLAAAPIFDAAGFTSLSPSCSGPSLTDHGFTSFHRLTNPNDRIATNSIRYLARESGAVRLAILQHADDPYYRGLARAAAAEFSALGGEVVLDLALSEAWEPAAVLSEIAAAGADAIYCACNAEWARALLSLPAAPHQQLPFLGESHFWANYLVAELGALADGVYFSSDYPYALPATRELAARYKGRFGAAPHSPYFATAYDSYQLLLDAILAVGTLDDDGALHIDRAALNAEIRSTSDYAGVTGPISCDASGECLTMPTAVLQIREGNYFLLDVTLPENAPDLPDYHEDGRYLNCSEIREKYNDGNFWEEHPAYTKKRDRDNDGLACELN